MIAKVGLEMQAILLYKFGIFPLIYVRISELFQYIILFSLCLCSDNLTFSANRVVKGIPGLG